MIYGSVCSGIEAASVAWHPLGWRASFLSEIEPFPRAVLSHHYPTVPLHGDFTTIQADQYEPINLLVGGTPCQSFSVAGLRGGMADERGNLALEYLRLADRMRPRWLLWENVPGFLSSNGGRDFGSFLGGLGQLGYGFAYRVLDAQFFGLAQRRKRVFVVGHLRDWRRAAAVLFEPQSLRRDTPPRRETGESVANTIRASSSPNGHGNSSGLRGDGSDNLIAHTLGSHAAGSVTEDGTGRGVPLVAVAFGWKDSPSQGDSVSGHITSTLDKSKVPAASIGSAVRRLTPTECERLQGFPDSYTNIPWRGRNGSPDGPRYKALGNSMAVPVMRWIGARIAAEDATSRPAM